MAMGIDMQQPSPDDLIVEKINFLLLSEHLSGASSARALSSGMRDFVGARNKRHSDKLIHF
jgi:hypothetical protein